MVGEIDPTEPVLVASTPNASPATCWVRCAATAVCNCAAPSPSSPSRVRACCSISPRKGRGIGLVNKLRAYELQDDGFDTIDANEQLGFDADERIYAPAATMLTRMGISAYG